eukprot:1360828-Alexandrium_andersonii.AAC.1
MFEDFAWDSWRSCLDRSARALNDDPGLVCALAAYEAAQARGATPPARASQARAGSRQLDP